MHREGEKKQGRTRKKKSNFLHLSYLIVMNNKCVGLSLEGGEAVRMCQ